MEIVSVSQQPEKLNLMIVTMEMLVNAMCVGVIDHDMIQKGLLKVKVTQSFM